MKNTQKILLVSLLTIFASSFVFAANVTNESGPMYVNISNAYPVVENVFLEDNMSIIDDTMLLTPGDYTTIYCFGNASDLDGYADIDNVEGWIYTSSNTLDYYTNEIENLSSKYYNSSCFYNNVTGDFNCTFQVIFYADPVDWNCTIRVNDSTNTDEGWDNASMQELLAMDIPDPVPGPYFLDFGTMALGENRSDVNLTIENEGNIEIDFEVDAWETGGDENSNTVFNCSSIMGPSGNISYEYFKHSLTQGNYIDYTNTTESGYSSHDANLTKQVHPNTLPSTDLMWFGLMIPDTSGLGGECTGVVSVIAQPSS